MRILISLANVQYGMGSEIASCLVLARSTGRLLMVQRSPNVPEPMTWGTVGGKVNDFETPAKALKRSMQEDTGYTGMFHLFPLVSYKHHYGFMCYNFLVVVEDEFVVRLGYETHNFTWTEFGTWPTKKSSILTGILAHPKNLQTVRSHIESQDAEAA